MKGDTRKPAKIGRYEVVDQLGAGGMGIVYLATDPLLRRTVAIKALPGHDEELRERFAREGRSAASLRHNNIVTIYDVGEDDGNPFLAMEFIDGESMAELIRRRAPLTIEQRLKMMIELCAGLGYAHRNGIVHRDIKPGNLMITAEGTLKVLDFGLARITSEGKSTNLTQAGSILGTPHYMCPEQVEGKPVDPRSDIFSVGLVLYELLSYQKAYAGDSTHVVLHNIVHTKPRPIQELMPEIDPDLVRIIERSIEKRPEDRYQELGTFAADLERVRARSGNTLGTTRIEPRQPGRQASPPVNERTPAREGRTRANPNLVEQRRAAQVESHLKAAGEHMAAGRYEDAIAECEIAMLLSPQDQRALALVGQAQTALDDRQVRQLLNEARARLDVGELTAAQALIDQTLMLRADLEEAQQLRRDVRERRAEIERKAERMRAAKSALERARRNLDEGAFEAASRSAAEVLAYDPTNEGALDVRRRAAEAIEARRRQHELEQRAADVVEQARLRAAAGSPRAALTLLEAFTPPTAVVTEAIAKMRIEIAALERREKEDAERRRVEEEARARQEAEEQARREAEETARREAEEKARRDAEEKARREAEQKARRDADEKARRDAEEKARREADEKARREAEEKGRRDAEETARRDAEDKARLAAEEKARREAEEKARRAAEDKARRDAEEKVRLAAEDKARREAEENARRVAEEKARRDAEEKARRAAEEKARREAEEKARSAAEDKARREAEEKARRKAQEEEERRAARPRVEDTAILERSRETVRVTADPTPPPVASGTAPPRPVAPSSNSAAVLGGIAAVLLLLIGGGWYFTRDRAVTESPVTNNSAPAATAPDTTAKPADSTAAANVPAAAAPTSPAPAPVPAPTTPNTSAVPEAEITRVHTAFTAAMRRNNLEQAARVILDAPPAWRTEQTIAADVDRVLAAAKQRASATLAQSQKNPAAPGSADFRTAEASRVQAATLERRGQLPEAARDYLAAASGYTRALAAKPATVAESREAPSTPTAPAPTTSTSTAAGNPPPPVTTPAVVEAPPTNPPPAPAAPAPKAPVDTTAADTAAIKATLAQFVAGYETLDAGAIKRVYPSAPANLAFNNVRSYSLTLDAPQISISGDRATVRTVRRLRVQMRAGAPQQQTLPTEFTLRRAGNGWIVESIK